MNGGELIDKFYGMLRVELDGDAHNWIGNSKITAHYEEFDNMGLMYIEMPVANATISFAIFRTVEHLCTVKHDGICFLFPSFDKESVKNGFLCVQYMKSNLKQY